MAEPGAAGGVAARNAFGVSSGGVGDGDSAYAGGKGASDCTGQCAGFFGRRSWGADFSGKQCVSGDVCPEHGRRAARDGRGDIRGSKDVEGNRSCALPAYGGSDLSQVAVWQQFEAGGAADEGEPR